ncbi:MAG TPA: hypothetical protein VGB84_00115 [Arachidicoccus sp.]
MRLPVSFIKIVSSAVLLSAPAFSVAQDADDARWIKQHNATKDFRFELLISGNSGDEDGTVYAVKMISKKTGKIIQTDSSVQSNLNDAPLNDMIHVKDCNFDGFPDFYFYSYTGGANSTYNFYLFDTAAKKFVYDEELSNLTNPEIDEKDKVISVTYRGSASDHGSEEYKYINGKLTRISLWDQDLKPFPSFSAEKIGGIDKQGVWREHIFRGIYEAPSYKIYAQPDIHSKVLKVTGNESYNVIDSENNFWFHVYGDTAGWVQKEAVLANAWVAQSVQTNTYRFETTDSNAVIAIKVIRKKDNQTIQILSSDYLNGDSLQLADANFDGLPDLKTANNYIYRLNDTVSFDNDCSDYYVYDPQSDLFIPDTFLSSLPNLILDKANKTYISSDSEWVTVNDSTHYLNSFKRIYQKNLHGYFMIYKQDKHCDKSRGCKIITRIADKNIWKERVDQVPYTYNSAR